MVQESGLFDADWYRARYRDTDMIGMDPCLHFLRYGKLLRRSPGPGFDTGFYMDTYADTGAENPLLHYLRAGAPDHWPVTRQAHETRMADLRRRTETEWRSEPLPPDRARAVSYCIPVMGRLSDLEGTLEWNLQNNMEFRDRIEFLVVAFGSDTEVEDWIADRFPEALADGYLRVVSDAETLDTWHFGKAKNAFRPHLHGRIYSSLDADNFVAPGETRLLLDLLQAYPDGFVFHHFSGIWGDGTSGRVSMPAAIYRHVGYDGRLLPRQYDEIDLILGSLTEFPALPFVGINADRHIFVLSGSARDYFNHERLPNRRVFIGPADDHRSPLNPRGTNYTETAMHWREMGNLNAALSACRRSRSEEVVSKHRARVDTFKHRLIEVMPAAEMMQALFRTEPLPPVAPITPESICVVACVHDEEDFLPRFVAHHRSLGATHFLFVDDHSALPVRDLDLGGNVLAVRPKVGDFRTCKTLWMEGLIKAFVPQDTWLCILDADEMLQLPDPFEDLGAVTDHLDAQGRDFAPCLLLDMLPDLTVPPARLGDLGDDFESVFGWFCDKPAPASASYRAHKSVAWGFGPHADISWRVDARFHAFGTFDSLRKLSLCRYRPGRHLNQGFHSFHHTDGTAPPAPEIWTLDPILPVFHYKLVKLFSEAKRAHMLQKAQGYHARTRQNIDSIFGDVPGDTVAKLAPLAPHARPAADACRPGFFAPRVSAGESGAPAS